MRQRDGKLEQHWLLQSVSSDLKEVRRIVADKKVRRKFYGEAAFTQEEVAAINKVAEALELAAIDSWRASDKEQRFTFSTICREYADILQIAPLPTDHFRKMKSILKLVAFSYLGEKWEDGRRFLKEREDVWRDLKALNKDDWDIRLFADCYEAILLMVRKQDWNDLSKASEIIVSLRNAQKKFEESYLQKVDGEFKKAAAYEVASFYHLARSIELLAKFNLSGEPSSAKLNSELDFHFEKGIDYARLANSLEFELILRILQEMFRRMIYNSIWRISETINSRVTMFVNHITKVEKPVFELLYPQRASILEQGLLDPAHRAIVVNLPTSSGKTLIAEFRILQALNQFGDEGGWIAYVAPTRALVNQMAARLKRDLGPLGIKVEKMSGALEIDAFEEELLSKDRLFDILLTTPEKLNMLIKQKLESKLGRPLVLVVADEIQSLEDAERGLNLEILLSTIQNDCKKANFLLLTPFVPNGNDIAKWLDPENPKAISLELDWSPNDKVVGIFYAEGKKKDWKTCYKPLVTMHETISLDGEYDIGRSAEKDIPIGKLKTKYVLSAVVADQMREKGNNLVIGGTIDSCWNIAKILNERFPENGSNERIDLVRKFVAAELGEEFPLVQYLGKRIGVHHSGLPDEVKFLMEWLMEEGELKALVATTTIAHGINFPVSGIFMSSYSYPWTTTMPSRDFWNLAGRAGRIDHGSLGIVGLAVDAKQGADAVKVARFVQEKTKNLVSILIEMVNQATRLGDDLNLETMAYSSQWSSFLQYVAHIYHQAENIEQFISESELTLRRTYGYSLLNERQRKVLLEAVKTYAKKLDTQPHLATLSELTGFSPETINRTMGQISSLGITQSDWNSSRLFSDGSQSLRNLIGVMLTIPEIQKSLSEIKIPGQKYTQQTIAQLITDWISGKELTQITRELLKSDNERDLSKCVSYIYSKIVNSATWGLASIQKLPTAGIDFEKLTPDESRRLKNIPAMIYYGVNTDEGILMRSNNVPRSISKQLGTMFKREHEDIYRFKPADVTSWLGGLSEDDWDKAVPRGKKIAGSDYKAVWKKLSGLD